MTPTANSDQTPEPPAAAAAAATESVRPIPARWLAAALLAGLALLAATMIALRPRDRARVVAVIEGPDAEAYGVNRGEVADTLRDPRAVAREGRRYRVRIEDESDDGRSGVARIGGLVTFVPDARPGQIAVIEVAAVRPRVANAFLVRVESEPDRATVPAPSEPPSGAIPPPDRAPPAAEGEIVEGAAARAEDVQPGRRFRVAITEASRQNPESEAVARIGGLVTIVRGGKVGERCAIRIVERRARVAFAEVVEREAP